jgi:hypothetical protein
MAIQLDSLANCDDGHPESHRCRRAPFKVVSTNNGGWMASHFNMGKLGKSYTNTYIFDAIVLLNFKCTFGNFKLNLTLAKCSRLSEILNQPPPKIHMQIANGRRMAMTV